MNTPFRSDSPSFGRRPGEAQEPQAEPSEDHDLNDIGLVRGAVPESVWTWRRRKRS